MRKVSGTPVPDGYKRQVQASGEFDWAARGQVAGAVDSQDGTAFGQVQQPRFLTGQVNGGDALHGAGGGAALGAQHVVKRGFDLIRVGQNVLRQRRPFHRHRHPISRAQPFNPRHAVVGREAQRDPLIRYWREQPAIHDAACGGFAALAHVFREGNQRGEVMLHLGTRRAHEGSRAASLIHHTSFCLLYTSRCV